MTADIACRLVLLPKTSGRHVAYLDRAAHLLWIERENEATAIEDAHTEIALRAVELRRRLTVMGLIP